VCKEGKHEEARIQTADKYDSCPEVEYVESQGGRLHPCAEERDHLAYKPEPVIRIAEGCEGARQGEAQSGTFCFRSLHDTDGVEMGRFVLVKRDYVQTAIRNMERFFPYLLYPGWPNIFISLYTFI
jgi:hypothetical protein